MNESKNDVMLFLMISTVLGQFDHSVMSASKDINKLRKDCRLKMAAPNPKAYAETMEIAKDANDIWFSVQEDMGGSVVVTTVPSLQSLFELMTPEQRLIKPKVFSKALAGMERLGDKTTKNEISNTKNGYLIRDAIAKKMGITVKNNGLKSMMNRVRNNLIIEGKIT